MPILGDTDVLAASGAPPQKRAAASTGVPLARPLAYVLAVALTLATLLIRLALGFAVGDRPLLIFFVLPVLVAAYAGGIGPGLVSTALSAGLVKLVLYPALRALYGSKSIDEVQWGALIVCGVVISLLSESLHRSRRRAVESERPYRLLVETSLEGIWSVDADLRMTFVNEAFARMLGYTRGEMLGRNAEEFSFEEDLADVRSHMDARRHGVGEQYERRFRRKDGSECWCLVTGTPMTDAAGVYTGSFGVSVDVTHQRRAEEQLRAALLYSRSLLEASLDPLVTISPEGRITDVNEATVRATGVSRQLLVGSRFSDYFTEPDRAEAGYKLVLSEGEVRDFPLTLRHVSGRVVDVLYNATIYRDDTGTVQGVFAAARDVTERHRAEQEILRLNRLYNVLRQTNEMLVRVRNRQELFDEACRIAVEMGLFRMAWIGLVDAETRVVKPVAMWGEVGQYLENIHISLDDVPEGRGPTGTALREGRHVICPDIANAPFMEPWRHAALAREYRSSAAFPFRTRGVPTGVFTVYSSELSRFAEEEVRLLDELAADISFALENLEKDDLRLQAEEEIRRLNVGLEERVRLRTAELAAANEELEGFAYAVSHDLRAPLRALAGFSQALVQDHQGWMDAGSRNYLDQITLASKKMGELIDGILQLSRVTRGELHRDDVDLSGVAGRILGELARSEPSRSVNWQVEPGLRARGDARLLETLLTNLIGNAWKYTRGTEAPMIRLFAERSENMTMICVSDNGAGFDMAYSGKLFQPFQRLHRQSEFPGLGIGLATVQRIVRRHGGEITATGAVGRGATFRFTLAPSVPEFKEVS